MSSVSRPLVAIGAVALAGVWFAACSTLQFVGATHDGKLPAQLREEIDGADAQLFAAIRSGNSNAVLEMVPEELREAWGGLTGAQSFVESFREVLPVAMPPTWHMTEIRFSQVSRKPADVPPENLAAPKAFILHIEAAGKRMVCSLRQIPDGRLHLLLSSVWVRVGDTWRLYGASGGLLSVDEKDALDWFEEAVRSERDGALMAATMRAGVGMRLLHPVPYFQYVKEQDVRPTMDRLQTQVRSRWHFPVELRVANARASVFRIEPSTTRDEGAVVIVNYVRPSGLDDRERVNADVKAIHPAVLSEFPGLCDGVTSIVYKGFATLPTDPKTNYATWGTAVSCGAGKTDRSAR